MAGNELVLRFASQAALTSEHAQNLSHGRAFVSGQTNLPLFAKDVLTLEHPVSGAHFEIAVEVVMVMAEGPMCGSALQFVDRGPDALAALDEFVNYLDDVANDQTTVDSPEQELDAEQEQEHELDEGDDEAGADGAVRNLSRERQIKMRNLTPNERTKMARVGTMDERVMLERIYGVLVWETLLRNAKITVPEVARMARKATMPRPLLDLIVENEQWIRQSIVRRALLGNPRLSSEGAVKVLRTLPARELKLVPQQTAYPAIVRAAAQRLMRG